MSTASFSIGIDASPAFKTIHDVSQKLNTLGTSILPVSFSNENIKTGVAKVLSTVNQSLKIGAPKIEVKTPQLSTDYTAEVTKIISAIKSFDTNVLALKSNLSKSPVKPGDIVDTKALSASLKIATKDSKDARKDIVANFSGLISDIKNKKLKVDPSALAELEKLAEKVKLLYGKGGLGAGGEGTLFRKFIGKADTAAMQKSIAEYQRLMQDLGSAIGSGVKSIGAIDAGAAGKQVADGVGKINTALKSEAPKIATTSGSLLTNIGNKIKSSAIGVFSQLGKTFTGLFSGLFAGFKGGDAGSEIGGFSFGKIFGAGAIGASILAAANLEKAMSNIATITLQSGESLRVLEQNIINVSNATGQSAITVANAVYDIASAGYKGADGMAVLRSSLMLAQGGLTDVKTTAAAISRTMRAWSMDVSQGSRVADVLFNTVKRGITSPQELAQQITRVTSVAAAAGVTFEEVGAMLANLTRNGQTTEQAITGLSAMLKAIIAPAERGKVAAKELGLEWDESAVRVKGFTQVLIDAAPKILANKEVFKKLVGDISGLKSALVLSSNITNLDADVAAMNERGASAQAAAIVAAGFNEQLSRMWNNLLNIFRNVGQVLLPLIMPVLDMLQNFSNKLATITNSNLPAFLARITENIANIWNAFMAMLGSILDYGYSYVQKFGAFLVAVGGGALNSLKAMLVKFATTILADLYASFLRGFNWLAKTLYNIIMSPFRYISESWKNLVNYLQSGSGILGDIFSAVGTALDWTIGLVTKVYDVLDFIITWINETLWGEIEETAKMMDSISKTSKQSGLEMGKAFNDGFDSVYNPDDYDTLVSNASNNIANSTNAFGESILNAGRSILSNTEDNLRIQQEGIRNLINELEKDYLAELAAGETKKAQLTQQFINQQKDREATIIAQLEKSELDAALETRQALWNEYVKAEKANNATLQKSLIAQIKENELTLLEIEEQARLNQQKILEESGTAQINLLDSLISKSTTLASSGKELVGTFTSLDQALDNIFGKNVERLSKEYGIGTEVAAARKMTRDVIEARQAGFDTADIDRIIRVGLFTQSDALTKINTAFAQTSKQLSVSDLQSMGLYDEIVTLLDRASALGLSEQGRMDLLQGALARSSFEQLDVASIPDKTTDFITTAQEQFENIAQESELNRRLAEAQNKLGNLTKTAVSRNQQLQQIVEELEANVAEIERLQNAREAVISGGIG